MPRDLSNLVFDREPLSLPQPEKRRGLEHDHSHDQPRRQSGHRREVDPRLEHVTFDQRRNRSLIDVGIYRVVSFRDLVKAHFDGHPYVARRAIDNLKRDGCPHRAHSSRPQGWPLQGVISYSRRGRSGIATRHQAGSRSSAGDLGRPRQENRA